MGGASLEVALWVGMREWSNQCDWIGDHIWLSVLGPELEVGAEVRTAAFTDLVKF